MPHRTLYGSMLGFVAFEKEVIMPTVGRIFGNEQTANLKIGPERRHLPSANGGTILLTMGIGT